MGGHILSSAFKDRYNEYGLENDVLGILNCDGRENNEWKQLLRVGS